MNRTLLVVSHSTGGTTASLTEAAVAGTRDPQITGVRTRTVDALTAEPGDVLNADGYLLATPAHFGYMSGALKHFFDRIFYEVLDDTPGRPFALIVKGGHDAAGAVESVLRIVTGLGWRPVADPLVVLGEVTPTALEAAYELGATLAAHLDAGL